MLGNAVHALSRRVILAAAESEAIRGFVRRHGMRFGARRFVAGETFEEAVPVLRRLNDRGLLTNTTLLGEGVREPGETRAVVEEYERVLDGIARASCARTSRSSRRISASRSTASSRARTSRASRRTRRGTATS